MKETIIIDNDEGGQKPKSPSNGSLKSVNSLNGGRSISNGSLPMAHRQVKRQSVISNTNKKSDDIELQNIDASGNTSSASKTESQRLEMDVRTELLPSNDAESGGVTRTKPSATTVMVRVFMQAATMTFLAEWGDRSQLATIILSARENVYGVIIGGVIGHAICTGIAVVGGRMIAQRISVRTVTLIGGVVFLLFAVSSLFFDPEESPPDNL